jgi:5-methylcytosine-specific restriction endonuclease McrA
MINKQKRLETQRKWRIAHPDWQQKYRARRPEHFKQYDRQRYLKGGIARKLLDFRRNGYTIDPLLTVDNLRAKFGSNPHCYLTGKSINLDDITSYSLDHIIPLSRGGQCSLANCGLTTRIANLAKNDMTAEEFWSFCRQAVQFRDGCVLDTRKVNSLLS